MKKTGPVCYFKIGRKKYHIPPNRVELYKGLQTHQEAVLMAVSLSSYCDSLLRMKNNLQDELKKMKKQRRPNEKKHRTNNSRRP